MKSGVLVVLYAVVTHCIRDSLDFFYSDLEPLNESLHIGSVDDVVNCAEASVEALDPAVKNAIEQQLRKTCAKAADELTETRADDKSCDPWRSLSCGKFKAHICGVDVSMHRPGETLQVSGSGGFETLLRKYWCLRSFAERKSKNAPHVFVVGAGPSGLFHGLFAYLAGARVTIAEKREVETRLNVLQLNVKGHAYANVVGWLTHLGIKEFAAPSIRWETRTVQKKAVAWEPTIGSGSFVQMCIASMQSGLEAALGVLGAVPSGSGSPIHVRRRLMVCGPSESGEVAVRQVKMGVTPSPRACPKDDETDGWSQSVHSDFEALPEDVPADILVGAEGTQSKVREYIPGNEYAPIALTGANVKSRPDPIGFVTFLNGDCPPSKRVLEMLKSRNVVRCSRSYDCDMFMEVPRPGICYLQWRLNDTLVESVNVPGVPLNDVFQTYVQMMVQMLREFHTETDGVFPEVLREGRSAALHMGLHLSKTLVGQAHWGSSRLPVVIVGDAAKEPYFPTGISVQTIFKGASDGFWEELVDAWKREEGALSLAALDDLNSLAWSKMSHGLCFDQGKMASLSKKIPNNVNEDPMQVYQVLQQALKAEYDVPENYYSWTLFCERHFDVVKAQMLHDAARLPDFGSAADGEDWDSVYPLWADLGIVDVVMARITKKRVLSAWRDAVGMSAAEHLSAS